MTPAEIQRLEALRSIVIAAHNATRAAIQAVETFLMEQPTQEADMSWDTFDSTPAEVPNGKQKRR